MGHCVALIIVEIRQPFITIERVLATACENRVSYPVAMKFSGYLSWYEETSSIDFGIDGLILFRDIGRNWDTTNLTALAVCVSKQGIYFQRVSATSCLIIWYCKITSYSQNKTHVWKRYISIEFLKKWIFSFHVNGSIGIVQEIKIKIRSDLGCRTPLKTNEKSGFGQSVCLSCLSVCPSACLPVAFSASSHGRKG